MATKEKLKHSPENYCPSCSYENMMDRWAFESKYEKLSVLWCSKCGFGWLSPFPSQTELTRLYVNQPVYCLNYKSENSGGFPIRVKRISDLVPKRGRLLDVGSGIGYFLNIAQDDGWEVEGIEPRSEAVEFCYKAFGIKVHQGFLEDFDSKPDFYDVITLWDVLEHVSDHIQFLEKCTQLLTPGGILVIAIPNASGWPARVFKGRWRYVMSTHLNYFTMRYITQLISSRNLKIERVDHTVKLHSLVQGLISWLPIELDTQKIFSLGSDDNSNVAHQGKNTNPAQTLMAEINPLKNLRKIAYKLNMMRLPWGIGDMVDLYCRKIP